MAKAAVVITYDLPEDTEDGYVKLQEIVQTIRHLFEDKEDVEVGLAIKESADSILAFLKGE